MFASWAGPWGTLWGIGGTKDCQIQTHQHFGTRLGPRIGCVCKPPCYENLFLEGRGMLVSCGFPLWVAVKLRQGQFEGLKGPRTDTKLLNIFGLFRAPFWACFRSFFQPIFPSRPAPLFGPWVCPRGIRSGLVGKTTVRYEIIETLHMFRHLFWFGFNNHSFRKLVFEGTDGCS